MTRYKDYKASGIEWLGDIPSHWKLTKVSQVYQQRNVKVSDKEFKPLSVTKKGILPQLENVAKSDDSDNRKQVLQGDFVINSRSDRRGSCGISPLNGSVSLINTVIYSNIKIYNNYYGYLYKTELFADEYYRLGFGIVNDLWATRWQNFKSIEIPIPPLEEQEKIAQYLDMKTQNIDELIEDKQNLIARLKEQRTALISETVTRGLNTSVVYKDSGIEWLGEIPSHWEVKPLYTISSENKHANKGSFCKNLLSLSYGNIIRKDITTKMGLLPESFETYQIVQKGYIVLRLTDLQNDKKSLRTGYAKEEGIITSAYIGLIPKETIYSQYFYLVLYSYDLIKVFYNLGSGVRQSMTFKDLKKLIIPIPPLEEQEEIAQYLDIKTQKIDELITDIQSNIEQLKNYRQSLISEIVTGKWKI